MMMMIENCFEILQLLQTSKFYVFKLDFIFVQFLEVIFNFIF